MVHKGRGYIDIDITSFIFLFTFYSLLDIVMIICIIVIGFQ